MSEHLYFAGDPATDSARRHLERVLKEESRQDDHPRRMWPWIALVATGSLWTAWRLLRRREP